MNPDEVADFKWISIDDLQKDIVSNPDTYTQWFKIILENYLSNKKSISLESIFLELPVL